MKRVGNFIILIGLTVGSCGPLYAQKPTERTVPCISEQELSRFDASKLRGDFAAAPAGAKDRTDSPFDVVVQFLQLNSTQAQQFQQLLTARQKALEPLIQQISALNTQLQGLLDSGGPAPAVGQTVIQIHQLQVQAGQAQQSFLEQFQNLLDPDQRQRLEAARLAAQLQPIVPAFHQLQLL